MVDGVAVAALFLLLIGGAIAGGRFRAGEDASRPAATPADPAPRLVYPLYRGVAGGLHGLTPIDPLVLADRPDGQTVFLAPLSVVVVTWTLSGDGSTLALLQGDGPDEAVVVVRDALSGAERVRFAAPADGGKLLLSRDGSRLVIGSFARTADAPDPVLEWRTFDARTGARISTARPRITNRPFTNGPLPGWIASDWAVVDPTAQRLYQVVPGEGEPDAATPVATPTTPLATAARLLVFDLSTGAQVGAVDLPGVRFEPAPVPSSARGQSTVRLAVSADGGRVAIPHPDGAALTLVNVARLRVEHEIPVMPPHDGAAATPTAGPITQGWTILAAAFSPDRHPDAQRVYVSGFVSRWSSGVEERRSIGVLALDARTGGFLARALADRLVRQVEPAPDGASVYVVHREIRGPEGAVSRLDAFTLAVVAERRFSQNEVPSIVVQPAALPVYAPDAPGEGDLEIRLHLCPSAFQGAIETARNACRYPTPAESADLGLSVTRTGEPVSTIARPDAEGVVLFHWTIGELTGLLIGSPPWTVLADCHDASGRPVETRTVIGGMAVTVKEDSPVLCDWYLIPPSEGMAASPTS